MWQDIKFASRQLLRHPISNGIIVMTIALLLGAISTVYASFLAVDRRETPFPDQERVVKLWRTSDEHTVIEFPYSIYLGLAENLTTFDSLGAMAWMSSMTLTDRGEPVTYSARKATAGVFQLTGFPPHLGRLFNTSDEEPGGEKRVILSHQVWSEKFEGDPEIIGQSIRLNDELYEVVGVLDARMNRTALGHQKLWFPLTRPTEERLGLSNVSVVGRLLGTASESAARAELTALASKLEAEHTPSEWERRQAHDYNSARFVPVTKNLYGQRSAESRRKERGAIIFAIAILVSVVLIACFNVTNLLLIRATARARDIAIRLSVGASRLRIIRQLLTESVMLSAVGAVVGLSVAQWLWAYARAHGRDLQFDPQIFGVTALGALILGAMVGIVPAWQSSRTDYTSELKDGGHTSASKQRHRTRSLLVAAQVALAVLLCVGSTFMTRSYLNITQQDLGFDPAQTVVFSANLNPTRFRNSNQALELADRGLQHLREHPAVKRAAVSFTGGHTFFSLTDEVRFVTEENGEEKSVPSGSWFATPNMFEMYGIHLVRGRGLNTDEGSVAPEIMVNELFVSEHLEGVDPIGHSVYVKSLNQWMTIVGVVRNRSPLTSVHETNPEFYASYRLATFTSELSFHIETNGGVKAAGIPLRDVLRSIDRAQPISQPKYLPDLINERLAGPKAAMIFLSAFAGFGVFIALLGIYGVVSFTVAERTHEVGIRMALGADTWNILRLLTSHAIRLLIWGGLIGFSLAFAVTQGIPEEFLYNLTPRDPITYLSVFILVGIVGTAASVLPTRKATRLSPMDALRYE